MKKTMKTCVVFGFALSLLMPTQMWAESSVAAPGPNAVEQARPVKGHVVDETGEPLIGVTVRVLGTNGGVVTDINGDFSVNAAPGQQLQFSYAGYKTVTMQAGQGAMNLTMEPDVLGLDDVVVIGYGTQKKRDLTGAVTSMKNADVVIAPTGNVMEALQGKIAGFDITKESGEIGAGVNLLLRGSRSIYGDNQPLFIIDGLPGSYDNLSPNDIESVDVLKDASATAIYGSAGANGAVSYTHLTLPTNREV